MNLKLELMECMKIEKGDKFTLRHYLNENQNQYSGVVFEFDGQDVFPLEITQKSIFWSHLLVGKYTIKKQ